MKSLIALLALIIAAPVLAEDNIVVVLDTSGSMAEPMSKGRTKMETAQTALLQVFGFTKPTTNVGIVGFDGWILPLGSMDQDAAFKAIQVVRTRGGTPLGEYMKIGADALLQKREKSHGYGTYTLLVITDGQADDDEAMHRYIQDIISRGLSLKTIGVRMLEDHALKQYSAAYFRGDDLQGLQNAISTVMAEIPDNKSGDGADDFAFIQGIPDDMASKIVLALADAPTSNYPIGETPPVVKTVDPQGNLISTPQPDASVEEGVGLGTIFGVVVIVCFGIAALIVVVRFMNI